MVMAQIQLEFVKKTLQYKILRDEFDTGVEYINDKIFNPYDYNEFDSSTIMNDYYKRLNGII